MDEDIIYEYKVEVYDTEYSKDYVDWGVLVAKSISEATEKVVLDYEGKDETITNLEIKEYGSQLETFSIFGYLIDHENELNTMRQAYDKYKAY